LEYEEKTGHKLVEIADQEQLYSSEKALKITPSVLRTISALHLPKEGGVLIISKSSFDNITISIPSTHAYRSNPYQVNINLKQYIKDHDITVVSATYEKDGITYDDENTDLDRLLPKFKANP